MSNLGIRNAYNNAPEVLVYDVRNSFFPGAQPAISQRLCGIASIYNIGGGNFLDFTGDYSNRTSLQYFISLLRLPVSTKLAHPLPQTLKTAEVVSYTHSECCVHGLISPWAFSLDAHSVTLFSIDLYRQAQERLEYIHSLASQAHGYKARAELLQEEAYVPTEAMDIYSWGKTIVTLYSRSIFQPQPPHRVHHLTRPLNMPEEIWRIVQQCLSEDLNIQVNMAEVVAQLRSIA